LRYIDQLDALFKRNGISKAWITDTGRNGKADVRNSPQECEQWCNVKGGLGLRPTSNVSAIQSRLHSAMLDAVVWSKTPGESDGCSPNSSQKCTRVDSFCQRDCNSSFQKCPAPEAGQWDDDMIKVLVQNANPAL
jgi:cellulase/cellobiase CelA1